jgi:hypothetical protein
VEFEIVEQAPVELDPRGCAILVVLEGGPIPGADPQLRLLQPDGVIGSIQHRGTKGTKVSVALKLVTQTDRRAVGAPTISRAPKRQSAKIFVHFVPLC